MTIYIDNYNYLLLTMQYLTVSLSYQLFLQLSLMEINILIV